MARRKTKDAAAEALKSFPPWAKTLAERYYTRTISLFLLHGAVRDLQPSEGEDGTRFVPLRSFLSDDLFGARDIVVFYDRSGGIRAATPEMQQDLAHAVEGYDLAFGTAYAKGLPREPGRALPLLESLARVRIADKKSVALVLDFAETVVPAADLGGMSNEDRYALVTLTRWAHDPQFLAADVTVVLIAENLAELHPRMARNPYAATIEIPLPDEKERLSFIEWRLGDRKAREVTDVAPEVLAQLTAGLSRVQLDRLVSEATGGQRVTTERVKARKKEMIQAEAHGLLEFIEPKWTLDMVAGHDRAKEMLRTAAAAVRGGRQDVVPMGFLIAGPIGTGKTFLATCFAGDIGIPVVKFMNFRSMWVGATEGNLEKIFSILKAMWPVAVIVDEADAMLGNRSEGGDSGTSQRVFGSIASFMGNTEYRGRIVWFLLTSRPDLLPVDLKRQGRAEEHLALFYPDSDAERDEMFRVMAKKAKVTLEVSEGFSTLVPEGTRQLSGADIEAALVRAKAEAVRHKRENVTREDLTRVLGDFVPPAYPLEVELQTLAAVAECTSRELLPPKYRQLPRDEVTRRMRELKLMLEGM
jgi:SpoVK/Ycf46/Vps4 family AAA+-type ATPase